MLYTVIEWVYYVCCMVCMVLVGEWTFHWTVRSWKRFVVATIIYGTFFVYCFVLSTMGLTLFYFVEIFSWGLICKPRWKDKVAKLVALSFVVGVLEAVFSVVVDMLLGERLEQEAVRLLVIWVTFLAWAVITKQKWYKRVVEHLDNISRTKNFLIITVIVLGVAVAAVGYAVQLVIGNSVASNVFRILVAAELCAVIFLVIWLIAESYQKKYYIEQNYLKEEFIRTQQEYYQTIFAKDKEMRSFRHDVASQLGVLQVFLERGDIDKAKEQLAHIHQNFTQASFHKICVGDEMLDAILSMMNQKAHEKGVQLEVIGEINGEHKHNEYELCTIFSNAINNADR